MSETWLLDPRDPLVFGNGTVAAPFVPRDARLPAPGTVAGMVRAAHVIDPAAVTPEDAHALLDIHVRGPWLVHFPDGGSPAAWVPAPADGSAGPSTFQRAKLLRVASGEGVTWPPGQVPPCLVDTPEKANGQKLLPIAKKAPFWPLDQAVNWALGKQVIPGQVRAPSAAAHEARALIKEARVHVTIDNTTGSAEPSALFGTSGTRFARDMMLAVEVSAPPGVRAPSSTVLMGGEARVSFRRIEPAAAFPSFDAFRTEYDEASKRPDLLGLRLQILTPACLHDEAGDAPLAGPAWIPPVPAPGLTLAAACVPGFDAISGWNLQAARGRGAPRSVRRLVPAGSVFWYTWDGPAGRRDALLALCERLWGASIDPRATPSAVEKRQHRNAPACDGYGLVLPGLWYESDLEG